MPIITSARSSPAQAVLPVGDVWVKDPIDPVRNVRVFHGEKKQTLSVARTRGVFVPLGRKKPVVIRGEAQYEEFTFRALVIGDAPFESLTTMLDSNRTLQLVMPKRYWYVEVAANYEIEEDEWSPSEPTARYVTVPFIEVDRVT